MQDVTIAMSEKGIDNMEWIEREELRRKIKFQAQKDDKKIDTLYKKFI